MVRGRQPADESATIYDSLGTEIRRARRELNQTELARRAGIADQTTVSDYERGRVRIPLEAVFDIERVLDMRRGELLIRAGLIDPEIIPITSATETAIIEDHTLDERARELLLHVYRLAQQQARDRPERLPNRVEDWPADKRAQLEELAARGRTISEGAE